MEVLAVTELGGLELAVGTAAGAVGTVNDGLDKSPVGRGVPSANGIGVIPEARVGRAVPFDAGVAGTGGTVELGAATGRSDSWPENVGVGTMVLPMGGEDGESVSEPSAGGAVAIGVANGIATGLVNGVPPSTGAVEGLGISWHSQISTWPDK